MTVLLTIAAGWPLLAIAAGTLVGRSIHLADQRASR